MQDPLKQGLKLIKGYSNKNSKNNSNARSTKTRIETAIHRRPQAARADIRMQDPLKQGLKLC